MKKLLYILFLMHSLPTAAQQTITGFVRDARTGESLMGVSIYATRSAKGTLSDATGAYSLQVKPNDSIRFSYIGYDVLWIKADRLPDVVQLNEQKTQMKEVVITAKREDEVKALSMSTMQLNTKQLNTLPALGGEQDIVKIFQLMPGVKAGSQGNTGMLVRGGTADQNLVLMDGATVYNASHMLGFFSAFNADALGEVSLFKGGFAAQYGGRLASVLDVKMREGNSEKWHVHLGAGLLASRICIDGPLVKNKVSLMVSARRTYVDRLFSLTGQQLPVYFYDGNAKLSWKLSAANEVFLSSFYGKDVLKANENSGEPSERPYKLNMGTTINNQTYSLGWKHRFNNQIKSQVMVVGSRFAYEVNNQIDTNYMHLKSFIQDIGIQTHFDWKHSVRNQTSFGAAFTRHRFRPNVARVNGVFNENIHNNEGLNLLMHEYAAYVSHEQRWGARWNLQYGIRLSGAAVNHKHYAGIEPRVTVKYKTTSNGQLSASYTLMNQYLHQVTSSSSTMPTDLWFPVTAGIKPQRGEQVALGYSHRLPYELELSTEVYYKWLNHVVEYKEGTVGVLNDKIEEDLVQGKGTSYGWELMVQRKAGKVNGWIGYTLSWATRQFETLNNGEPFFMRYDRRHDLSIVANYDITKRLTASAVWVYATGSRFTPVIGQYLLNTGSKVEVMPIYSKRNETVLQATHRLDVNLIFRSSPAFKPFQWELHVGAYNVYNQNQPYRIEMTKNNKGQMVYQQMGLFGFIPSLACHLKF